ncbi:helix-turn-helix transcriptional regulator [Ralstonia insidiosa]|uniref:helix-turn-helix transcriptional regulator n=1 Tax=Ralstonia insidiosa TaxID=190721 RepID=UPI000CEE35EB|nr:AlpA family phage regulatory protein [Ralstonia insidiosa]
MTATKPSRNSALESAQTAELARKAGEQNLSEILRRVRVLLRRPDVECLTHQSKVSIYKGIKAGTFPAPYRIGRRAVAWRSDDIAAWIDGLQRTTEPGQQRNAAIDAATSQQSDAAIGGAK